MQDIKRIAKIINIIHVHEEPLPQILFKKPDELLQQEQHLLLSLFI